MVSFAVKIRIMKFILFYVLCTETFLLTPCSGARVLGIFIVPFKSHLKYNTAIMKSLINAGHEVTVIATLPDEASSQNYSSILIDIPVTDLKFTFEDFRTQNVYNVFDKFIETAVRPCHMFIKLPEVQKILNSDEKLYDIVFMEITSAHKCYLQVVEKMNTPLIGTLPVRNSLLVDQEIHNPHHPAYIPNDKSSQKWKLDSIIGRIINVWNYLMESFYTNYIVSGLMEDFYKKYHADQLSFLERFEDIKPDIIFYNSHSSILPRPMNPNAIDVGGILIEDVKPLPKNIQTFIDEADHGVILFSLGSLIQANTLNADVLGAFREVFAEIPQRVIWKFEEKMENLSSNVMILDWLPQRDILEHKNVIGFISHCGLGSIHEAIYTATPVIACPLFCDQLDNAEILENLGVAAHLDIYDITKENILNALHSIINDTRYYHNMQKLSDKFKDRPMTPQQSVVYWTEYVLRHNGAAHLKSPASRLHWFQYFLLDVIFVYVLILLLVGYLVLRFFRLVHLKIKNLYFKLSKKLINKVL